MKSSSSTGASSLLRNAIERESGDHQYAASAWWRISSQYTNEGTPLPTVSLPSCVRRVSAPVVRSTTQRSRSRTNATRRPSGEMRGIDSGCGVRVSRSKRPERTPSAKMSPPNA